MTRVDVHLLQRHAAILDLLARDDLDVADLRERFRAPVRLDEADDDVHAAALEIVRLLEHAIRLARAGRRADVDLEFAALALANESEEVGGAGHGHDDRPSMMPCPWWRGAAQGGFLSTV